MNTPESTTTPDEAYSPPPCSAPFPGEVMGGHGRCRYCGESVWNVAYHEARACESRPEDATPEFEPCDVCGGTEANFDGFCSQCELPMAIKPNNVVRGAALGPRTSPPTGSQSGSEQA